MSRACRQTRTSEATAPSRAGALCIRKVDNLKCCNRHWAPGMRVWKLSAWECTVGLVGGCWWMNKADLELTQNGPRDVLGRSISPPITFIPALFQLSRGSGEVLVAERQRSNQMDVSQTWGYPTSAISNILVRILGFQISRQAFLLRQYVPSSSSWS